MALVQYEIAPGHWLDQDAAVAYLRMLAAGMPRGGISDAGRTRAEQEVMWARYLRGELPATAARPGTSKHETGRALDLASAARAWAREHGAAFGWIKDLVPREPWHLEYQWWRDQRLFAGAAPVAPTLPVPEEDDMPHPIVAVDPRRSDLLWVLTADLTAKRHLHSVAERDQLLVYGAEQTTLITADTIDAATWTPCHDVLADGARLPRA